ncbi:transcription factor Pur-alpha 1 [Senna tora]|uniref:Transcription factor Pur-alpha 1 n=1 Tax=Senna tora TaxID=362788 RepID=A0A834W2Z9_9FABA|nr:transcription factor Pur-alpha 1 [Senna tora]
MLKSLLYSIVQGETWTCDGGQLSFSTQSISHKVSLPRLVLHHKVKFSQVVLPPSLLRSQLLLIEEVASGNICQHWSGSANIGSSVLTLPDYTKPFEYLGKTARTMVERSETTHEEQGAKHGKKGRLGSREALADAKARLARVELAIADGEDKFEEVNQRIEELDKGKEELREAMQGALNLTLDKCLGQVKTLEETFKAEIIALKEEFVKVTYELTLCKKVIAQGGHFEVTPTSSKLDIPKPKFYKGARNAKELDNFLWGVEQYFKALGITEDASKIDTATLYLDDTARMWWRRRQGDVEKGTCTINTWAEFKKELKQQFYPVNAEEEARAKLRRLQHKGTIRDYDGHPVAYESRKLNDAERRYTVQEKEITVVVHCLRTWRHYLLGPKFVVKTDNVTTSYFLNQKKLTPKQARWQDFLAEFDFVMEYKPGKANFVADALSRKAELAAITSPSFPLVDRIKEGLEHDPQAKSLMELASQGKTRRFWLEDGVLITKGSRTYIPKWQGLRREIIKECHDSKWAGHLGKDWAKLLDIAQFSYNLQKSESTGASPFEIATGLQPMTPHTLAVGYTGPSLAAFKFAKGWHEKSDMARAYLAKATKRMKKWSHSSRSLFRQSLPKILLSWLVLLDSSSLVACGLSLVLKVFDWWNLEVLLLSLVACVAMCSHRCSIYADVSEASVSRNRSTIIVPAGSSRDEGWAAFRNILVEINDASRLFILPNQQSSESSERLVGLSDDVGAGFISGHSSQPASSSELNADRPVDLPVQDEIGNLGVSKVLRADQKKFFFDLGSNNRGHFLRISEVAGSDRSSIILPLSGLKQFHENIGHFVEITKDRMDGMKVATVRTVDPPQR